MVEKQAWSAEQTRFIADHYQTLSVGEMAGYLGRTAAAVGKRRRQLQLYLHSARKGAWSAEDDAFLRENWATLSASQIKDRLGGRTRNAVIGRAHRLGLSEKKRGSRRRLARPLPAAQAKPARRARGLPAARPPVLRSIDRDVACEAAPRDDLCGPVVAFGDLEPTHCRWPIGDPVLPGFGFCGGERVAGASYCGHHLARATSRQALKDAPLTLPSFVFTTRRAG